MSLDLDTLRTLSFPDVLDRLGDLHDCSITGTEWEPTTSTFRILIEDIFWNCEGFPEYPGALPGIVELTAVQSQTRLDPFFLLPTVLYDVTAVAVGDGYEVTVAAAVGHHRRYQKIILSCRDGHLIFGSEAQS